VVSSIAVLCFAATIVLTLGITIWAGRKSTSKSDYYAAGGRISGMQNGLAITGDVLSAAALLGTTAFFFNSGLDAAFYCVPPVAGFTLLLLYIAGPLRRLGRFTLADVVASRFPENRLRLFSGISTIVISLIYLVAQMVGAGNLVYILLGVPFTPAVVGIGIMMALYVAVGGMLAATWVQIIKAVLLVAGILVVSVLSVTHAGGLAELHARAAEVSAKGMELFQFGGFKLDWYSAFSLTISLSLGLIGLPHLLIRFFTVPTEQAARSSMWVAMALIAVVYSLLMLVVGPAAVAFVQPDPSFHNADGTLRGGTNMAILHLATVLGGPVLFGILSAVTFATILAVVAGLAIATSSAASHDLYAILRGRPLQGEKTELRVFRIAGILSAVVAVLLGILFQKENVGFLVALALSVAAGANMPMLLLTLYWKGLTGAGALAGGAIGLTVSVALIVLSPAVWVKILGFAQPVFPSEYPALAAVPLGFLAAYVVSTMTRQPEVAGRTA
jgi:cation/acetate symporter